MTRGGADAWLAVGLVLTLAPLACRADPVAGDTAPATDIGDHWAIHVQATDVLQTHPAFRSPYEGANSLEGGARTDNTFNGSLFAGFRPWSGAQIWFDLDVNQGFAPSDTLGVAGYVNGEGAKVGHRSPYYRPQRGFFRQTIDLGGGEDTVDPGLFEFGGKTTKNRLVITVGKFSLTDVMDDNAYAHDPTSDFLNWALIDTGSFDYAADAWGFSEGGVVEWYQGPWTLRGGVMALSTAPNDAQLTPWFGQFQLDGEAELRQSWFGREGKIKLLGFASRGRMGRFDDAVRLSEETGQPADTSLVRRYATRLGISLNLEQPVSDDAGLFLRAGDDQGQYEPYEYADIDQTVAAGASLGGTRWGRKDDTVALALVVNGISKAHQAYLGAGGLGILVGDGRLPHPGAEAIVESYYSLAAFKGVRLTLDSQTVVNPAYNRDRGPAEVIGLRVHGQY
jgi:high affinity Mn2+ porin